MAQAFQLIRSGMATGHGYGRSESMLLVSAASKRGKVLRVMSRDRLPPRFRQSEAGMVQGEGARNLLYSEDYDHAPCQEGQKSC